MSTKHMNGPFFARLGLVFLLATGFFSSCEKEKDTSSPAYKIAESEKLVIPATIELPANLPSGNQRVATYYAEGVQKYKAQLKAGTSEYEWVFVAPDAKLYDHSNKLVGTHGAGPFWQLSASDSIFAKAYAPAKTAPSAGNIDWLLLQARIDKAKTGVFTDVAYIQRIATTGGRAPSIAPTDAAATADVFYTAIYRFTKIKP